MGFKKKNIPSKTKLRRGDLVAVIAGNDKNKEGKILHIYPRRQLACVEGIRMQTHFVKPSQKNPKGGLLRKEGLIHLSNLQKKDAGQRTRIGKKQNESGAWVRYAKKTGNLI